MRSRNVAVAVVVLVLVAGGWYLFRPERLWINQKVSEGLPAASASAMTAESAEPKEVLAGSFHKGAHDTKGMAGVYDVAGKPVLRLTQFETSNGPDVHVYLVAANDAMDNATVTKAGYIDLGSLKGNVGDQNYDIPAGTDLGKYRAVTIWCARFHVNFGTAPLAAQAS